MPKENDSLCMPEHQQIHSKPICQLLQMNASHCSLTYSAGVLQGIGGDAFALYYSAKDKSVSAILGNGHSPGNLTMEVEALTVTN